jgi:hypothetical protein
MPQGAWSPKRERQYEAIKSSCIAKRGRGATRLCTRIAAATVNKTRVRLRETTTGVRCYCPTGYRTLKSDKTKCWAPGRARRRKICV